MGWKKGRWCKQSWMDAEVHKTRRAKLDRARKVREAEGERVDEDEGENEHTLERRRERKDRTRMEEGRTGMGML